MTSRFVDSDGTAWGVIVLEQGPRDDAPPAANGSKSDGRARRAAGMWFFARSGETRYTTFRREQELSADEAALLGPAAVRALFRRSRLVRRDVPHMALEPDAVADRPAGVTTAAASERVAGNPTELHSRPAPPARP